MSRLAVRRVQGLFSSSKVLRLHEFVAQRRMDSLLLQRGIHASASACAKAKGSNPKFKKKNEFYDKADKKTKHKRAGKTTTISYSKQSKQSKNKQDSLSHHSLSPSGRPRIRLPLRRDPGPLLPDPPRLDGIRLLHDSASTRGRKPAETTKAQDAVKADASKSSKPETKRSERETKRSERETRRYERETRGNREALGLDSIPMTFSYNYLRGTIIAIAEMLSRDKVKHVYIDKMRTVRLKARPGLEIDQETLDQDYVQYDKLLAEYTAVLRTLSEAEFKADRKLGFDEFMSTQPKRPHLGVLYHESKVEPRWKAMGHAKTMVTTCFFNFFATRMVQALRSDPSEAAEDRKLSPPARRQKAGVLSNPEERYPGARSMKRKWILHVGPTNSGKTYQALKRLQEAESGLYAGPLRLLAREIYDRMTANGIACNLVTGEDVIRTEDAEGRAARKTSSTVEMVDLDQKFDVAVIDEIQMIADPFRGWAWTTALLGVRAKELHLCGEERTVDILKTLARSLGDEVVVNRYKRLSPLEVEQTSLRGDLEKIRRGDALIAFSRRVIFHMRRKIEEATGLKCAVIYGGLPPETRARQAQLFNDEKSGVDVLVASDAVGMGLNLSVKRIVFETVTKFDGVEEKMIDHNLLKQIAGRAGRFRSANEGANVKDDTERLGLVTTLEQDDFKYLRKGMQSQPSLIRSVGVLPQAATVKEVAHTYPASTPFSEILARFYHEAVSLDLYTLCSLHPQLDVAQMIEPVRGLMTGERVTLLTVPVNMRMKNAAKVMSFFARAIANGTPISLVDMPYFELDTIMHADVTKMKTLPQLEAMNMLTTVYLWLSYRFANVLFDREGAMELASHIQMLIDLCLNTIEFRRRRRRVDSLAAPEDVSIAVGSLKDAVDGMKEKSKSWAKRGTTTTTKHPDEVAEAQSADSQD